MKKEITIGICLILALTVFFSGCTSYEEAEGETKHVDGILLDMYYSLYGDRSTFKKEILIVVFDDGVSNYYYAPELKEFYMFLYGNNGKNVTMLYSEEGYLDFLYDVAVEDVWLYG